MKKFKFNTLSFLFYGFCFIAILILRTAILSMVRERDYWQVVKDKELRATPQDIKPHRGNILADDGRILVTTLPKYNISLDFRLPTGDSATVAKIKEFRDSLYTYQIDSICNGLAQIFPDRNAKFFREKFEKGIKEKKTIILYNKATCEQYYKVKRLPLFRESGAKGGFNAEEVSNREKLYGTLASRFLGTFKEDTGRTGIEVICDSILVGTNGIKHKQKYGSNFVFVTDENAKDGNDIITTINVDMQEAAEKALLKKLKELDAQTGVAIVMEVATGDIKAMVNMTHDRDSATYYEGMNYALNALWEPGSTFKTASMLVALDDGYITPETTVEIGQGIKKMYKRYMKDHNWNRVPEDHQTLNVYGIMQNSSNVGVSTLIDKYYHDKPGQFIQRLHDVGMGIPLGMPMGADPRIRFPKKDRTGKHWANWSDTDLPWLSIGYVSLLPPISTLAFYNGIANNGKMVRPRFIKAIANKGTIIEEMPVDVLKEKICSDKALSQIRNILRSVVSEGLGKKAGNDIFSVSGKTGTAQYAENGRYGNKHMASFCGFFPSENPKYSCIVCIVRKGSLSGGMHCGPVFREISMMVMNQGQRRPVEEAKDSTCVNSVPLLSAGRTAQTQQLLNLMHMPWQQQGNKSASYSTANIDSTSQKIRLTSQSKIKAGTVPDVKNMGAKDAVYVLQRAGMKVRVKGQGRVKAQSIPAGTEKANGRTIEITLI